MLGAVLGTLMYRVSLVTVFYGKGGFLQSHAKIFTSVTSAIINLTIIMILTKVNIFYKRLYFTYLILKQ